MAKEDKELKAIFNIIKELKEVPAERRAPVIQYVNQRLKIMEADILEPTMEEGSVSGSSSASVSPLASSIKCFIDQKNPQNNYQLIACLGYWLDKKEGAGEFGAKEINSANSSARRPAISNTTRDLKNTQHQYKFITAGSRDKRKKMLTHFGEKVVEALPNQDEVKQIVKEARKGIGKRRKRRTSTKYKGK